MAWLDFTLLRGILQVAPGSTEPPCVAGVTSHTAQDDVPPQLRRTIGKCFKGYYSNDNCDNQNMLAM